MKALLCVFDSVALQTPVEGSKLAGVGALEPVYRDLKLQEYLMDSLKYPRTDNEVDGTHELAQEEGELSAFVSKPETTGDCFQRVLLSMNPRHVDALIDLTYGVLIFISIVLIVSVGIELGIAFGFGLEDGTL